MTQHSPRTPSRNTSPRNGLTRAEFNRLLGLGAGALAAAAGAGFGVYEGVRWIGEKFGDPDVAGDIMENLKTKPVKLVTPSEAGRYTNELNEYRKGLLNAMILRGSDILHSYTDPVYAKSIGLKGVEVHKNDDGTVTVTQVVRSQSPDTAGVRHAVFGMADGNINAADLRSVAVAQRYGHDSGFNVVEGWSLKLSYDAEQQSVLRTERTLDVNTQEWLVNEGGGLPATQESASTECMWSKLAYKTMMPDKAS